MKTILHFLIFSLSLAIVSCNGAQKKASEQAVKDFYKALQKDDTAAITKIYAGYDQLGGYYKSKSIEFKDFGSLDNDCYDLEILNHFTNGRGEKFSQTIHYLLKKDPKNQNKMLIYDSKGLPDFAEFEAYQFAVNTGFIDQKEELSDLSVVKRIKQSEKLIEIYYKDLIESLHKEVTIENWGWEFGFVTTYADGHGKVVNRSKYDFATLKYTLTFVDQIGNITKTDDGYLAYGILKAGASNDFTTITSDIGNATKAYIQIQFVSTEILDIIYDRKYQGNENKLVN